MFVSIWLGAFIAHPIAFFRGAGYGERMLAGTATAMIWSATVLAGFIGIYSPEEFVFLFFHHLVLGAPVVSLLCMAISEIICRTIARRKTGDQHFASLPGRAPSPWRSVLRWWSPCCGKADTPITTGIWISTRSSFYKEAVSW